MEHAPSSVFMVRPDHFGFNPQTAKSNAFQPDDVVVKDAIAIRSTAIAQFDQFVEKLKQHGIDVLTFRSPKHKKLPDAVFPNNWVTFHQDGKVIIYPMLAENRRLERRLDVIDKVISGEISIEYSDFIVLLNPAERKRFLSALLENKYSIINVSHLLSPLEKDRYIRN